MDRGAVASPQSIVQLANGGFQAAGGLSVTDLNYYTLYWDKLVIPGSREIYFQIHNEELLKKLDVLERPLVSIGYNSDDYPKVFPQRQLSIFEDLQKNNDKVIWSMHQIGDKYLSANDDRKSNLQFELFDALPVPDEKVHPESILEFKKRFSDEYISFHNYLDELYENVAYAPDEPLFQKKAYEKFRNSINDINKVSELQAGWFFSRYNLKCSMPAPDELINTIIGAVIAVADTGNPLVTGLGLLQAGKGFIQIQDKYEELLRGSNKEANLTFLAKAYSEEILK